MGPIGFVTPTKNMAVRPGQYLSGEGRIYHPYLAGWRDDVSSCDNISFARGGEDPQEAMTCK